MRGDIAVAPAYEGRVSEYNRIPSCPALQTTPKHRDMVPGATRVLKSIFKGFIVHAKTNSASYRFDSQQVTSYTRIRLFSAVPRLSLRPSCLDAHPPPTSSVSDLTDDDYVPFKQDWTSTGRSTVEATARSRTPSVHKVAQRTAGLTSDVSVDQASGFSIVEQADEFEPDIELREDVKIGVGSIQQLLGASFGGFPHRPLGYGSGEHDSTRSQNSHVNSAVAGEDAVMELSEENLDAIASEISHAQLASDAEPPIEGAAGRPSVRVAETQPERTKRPSSVKPTSQITRKKHSKPSNSRPREPWQIQKDALQRKFGEAHWQPRKRLSPDALDGIRAVHAQYPDTYTTPVLANHFKVSPEAIRRILKSKWRPSEEEAEERRDRWNKRGEKIWSQMVELGVKPPKKWREMGIERRPKSAHEGTPKAPRPSRDRPKKSLSREEEADWSTAAGDTPLAERIL